MYDFLEETLDAFDPNPGINIIPGWATAESRLKYPESSYTACVHDVAVGNFDICLADLWITPERNQLVTFLPALRNDHFYLVVPKSQGAQSDVAGFLSRNVFSATVVGVYSKELGFRIVIIKMVA